GGVAARGEADQPAGERRTRQADRAEVHHVRGVHPAAREALGLEMEVRAVVADEEVARRSGRGNERQQRRAIDLLEEPRVEAGLRTAPADLLAEDVVAHGAGEAG